ncbi:eukaryotic translation initiation factor 5-like [Histomonas meleagridis]|uniref:eukaryotic translation initiation factor 5-like n=1 Tax=Histomonas meleagridis TaxID=135588 RepID=UPI00355A9013|nr:eukaryotic translation initiation factor 5-like [Histomonas meleagridis]KAH0805331.1 eukaryotic translation initiation factor 5-like [Histomonas meleagridis]
MPAKIPMIPIKKDADEHYRYKMPRITARPQSSGNGAKTSILNGKAVAKAIGRPVNYLTQWFGYAFAVQAKQQPKQDIILLNGNHSEGKKLLNSLYEFIDNFVLCPVCQNPETTFEKKNNMLFLHCHSCGNESPCQASKSSAYIQKMHDWILSHITEETKNSSNVTTQIKKKGAESNADFPKANGQGVYINTEELSAILKTLEPSQDDTNRKATVTEEEADEFFKQLTDLCNSDTPDSEIYPKLSAFSTKAGYNNSSRLMLTFQAVFTGHVKDILDVISKHRDLLILVTLEETSQRELLSMMSQYVTKTHPELMSSAPVIWHSLFDNEIVEESALKTWLKKTSARFEKDKAKASSLRNDVLKQFYQWLDTAKYEEVVEEKKDEEEKEEDEKKEETKEKEEEDEIDIDSI